uniref:Uncharacterized protein n=1 Tax=Panagrolaimus davidi TaxID=227884 RepID=A0A914QEV7_9BILA
MLAAGGGIGAGLTYDGVHSVVTDKSQGFVAAIENAVENPKFSTIFDAAAVPTFDALGGIGGGKMGGQIRAKVDASVTKGVNVQKVNALEVARDAKLAQLDSLGENGGTTGQALQLGQEINALTSQIHQLQTGSTQFWYDVKQNQVVTQQTPTSVPIAGQYASDSDREALKNAFYEQKSTKQLQLTAQEFEFLLHDKYYDLQNTGKCYTRKQKEQSISSKHKASPNLTLAKAFTHTKLSSVQKQYYQNEQNPNLNKKEEKEMEDRAWLPVRMPNQFTYTVCFFS